MTSALETLADLIGRALAGGGNQLGGTFLSPGSTFSIGALLASLAVMIAVILHGKRRRSLRMRVLWRALFPRRLTRTASGRADLILFFGGILFAGLAVGWAVIAGADVQAWLTQRLPAAPAPLLTGAPAIFAVTALLFLAYEFAYWLDHWLMHRVPVLWQFHKVHHQAESLSLATNGRVHPVDTIVFYNIAAVVTGAAGALVGWAFAGVSAATIGGTNALIMVAAVAVNHLQHSHLWLRFGARGGRWLLGPAHHQLHHSAAPEHFDRNFGSTLALFDRLFGTFCMPAAQRGQLRFGVDDGSVAPHRLRALLVTPFVAAAGTLRLPRWRGRIGRWAAVQHEDSPQPSC